MSAPNKQVLVLLGPETNHPAASSGVWQERTATVLAASRR